MTLRDVDAVAVPLDVAAPFAEPSGKATARGFARPDRRATGAAQVVLLRRRAGTLSPAVEAFRVLVRKCAMD